MVTGMLTRTITGVVAAAIVLTLLTLPFPVPFIFIVVAWLIAIFELGRAVKAKPAGIVVVMLLHIAAIWLLVAPLDLLQIEDKVVYWYLTSLFGLVCALTLVLSRPVLSALLASKKRITNFCWHSFVFITFPLSFAAYWSYVDPLGLVILLGIVSANDTGAVAAGKLFGKHHIVPRVSPGKTLEGIIGGFAGMFAFIALVHLALANLLTSDSYITFYTGLTNQQNLHLIAIACAWLAFVGFIGDITFSAIKRCAGIKDFGSILPGHGGMLDRIDSLLFIAPWYFFLIAIVGLTTSL